MSETTHDPQGFEDAEAAERRRMAAQDEDALQADVDLDADEYWMAETDEFLLTRDLAEARSWLDIGHDVRRVRVQVTEPATPTPPADGEAEVEGWQSSCGFLAISPFCPVCGESRGGSARPLPADAERDAREAAWFRWLRDNPQAAAFTAVNVAKWVPAGPDLGATMASGTVVGEMEDAKNPDYRYHIAASSLPADVQEVVAQVTVTAKWMRGRIITSTDVPSLCVSGDEFADGIDTLLAHLTREGADA